MLKNHFNLQLPPLHQRYTNSADAILKPEVLLQERVETWKRAYPVIREHVKEFEVAKIFETIDYS